MEAQKNAKKIFGAVRRRHEAANLALSGCCGDPQFWVNTVGAIRRAGFRDAVMASSEHTVGFEPANRLAQDRESVRRRFSKKLKRVVGSFRSPKTCSRPIIARSTSRRRATCRWRCSAPSPISSCHLISSPTCCRCSVHRRCRDPGHRHPHGRGPHHPGPSRRRPRRAEARDRRG